MSVEGSDPGRRRVGDMPIEIRPSVAADADELGAVHVAAWRAAYRGIVPDDHLDNLDPVANAERRRHSFADGRPRVPELVAVVDGRIAGFTAYGRPRDEVPTAGASCG